MARIIFAGVNLQVAEEREEKREQNTQKEKNEQRKEKREQEKSEESEEKEQKGCVGRGVCVEVIIHKEVLFLDK